jgi:predicted PurR-regulated permease PerM
MTGRLISLGVVVIVTSVLLVLSYQVVSVFLLPLFLASVAVLLLRPVHVVLVRWCGDRRYMAAGIMTVSVMTAVLIPFVVGFLIAGVEAAQFIQNLDNETFQKQLNTARSEIGLDFPAAAECRFIESSLAQLRTDAARGATAVGNPKAVALLSNEFRSLHSHLLENPTSDPLPDPELVIRSFEAMSEDLPGTLSYQQSIEHAGQRFWDYKVTLLGGPWLTWLKELANPPGRELRTWMESLLSVTPGELATLSGRTGTAIARTVVGAMVFVFAIFFWFADGPRIINSLMVLSPLDDRYEEQLLAEFEVLVRAVVAGSIACALAQMILAGLGYWFAGLHSIFLLMALTGLMAMVPFVGATLVWIPICAWLIIGEGRMLAGVGLAIYCTLIVSTVDNVVRPWILLERASLHPLAALIGVLGGIQALGPTGVFVGPIVVAFLQIMLTLLHREFTEMDNSGKCHAASNGNSAVVPKSSVSSALGSSHVVPGSDGPSL